MSPLTMVARVSMGALAAMAIWLNVSPSLRLMASPSRSRADMLMPVRPRKRQALAAARARRVSRADSSESTRPVRITLWGLPSMLLDTTVPVTGVPRYTALTASGTLESAVSRKRVPMATPSAPQARAAAKPRPS